MLLRLVVSYYSDSPSRGAKSVVSAASVRLDEQVGQVFGGSCGVVFAVAVAVVVVVVVAVVVVRCLWLLVPVVVIVKVVGVVI